MGMEKIGLLAGAGKLPVACAEAARAMGIEVVGIALLPETDKALAGVVADYAEISIGHIDAILNHLKEKGVRKVTMIGKVTKEILFSGRIQPDARMLQLILSLPNRNDDTIMMMFVRELANAGIEAVDQTALIRHLMPAKGTISKREPTAEEKADMAYGFDVAKELGRLDIGQTVVVRNAAVMALEAIEGTDACIRRGGALAHGGAVVVKTAKPSQDDRFDVPSVGAQTIRSMAGSGCTALAIEAGKTLLVEREEVLKLAAEHDIAIAAI